MSSSCYAVHDFFCPSKLIFGVPCCIHDQAPHILSVKGALTLKVHNTPAAHTS